MALFINRFLIYFFYFQFMLRKQVLNLYRDLLYAIREVPNENDRKELTEWVRSDFKANKHHKDEVLMEKIFFSVILLSGCPKAKIC